MNTMQRHTFHHILAGIPIAALALLVVPSNRERNLWTLDLLEIESRHRGLEIGFGPGYAIEQLVPKLSTGKIVGVDHSEMMCYQAAQRNAKAIQSGMVELHCLSVEALNTLKQPFDRIFSANVAQFWSDRVAVYQDILALLKPGGWVVTTNLPRRPNAKDEDALEFGQALLTDMKAAGFKQVALEKGPQLPILTISAIGYVD